MQSRNARGFLEDQPARLRLGRNDLADLPLPHHRGRTGSGGGVGEQQLHVARARLAAIDAIGRAGFALDPAGDLDRLEIVECGRGQAIGIVEYEADFRDVARRTFAGPGEDHVVHAGATHVLVGALAHHPAHGLDEIRLAAAVGPDNAGEARLDLELGGLAKALESGQSQPLEFHGRRTLRSARSPRRAGEPPGARLGPCNAADSAAYPPRRHITFARSRAKAENPVRNRVISTADR